MSIPVIPHKLTLREMEIRLQAGVSVLPGQLLRFEGNPTAYGEVTEVSALPETGEALATVRLLHGKPGFAPHTAVIMTDDQMAAEVQRLQEPFSHPLRFGDVFIADWHRLGQLTIIEGDDLALKYHALMMLVQGIQPYRRVLIIDPLGIFSPEEEICYWRAGDTVRLSLQQIGCKRFLDTFTHTVAAPLRLAATAALADHLPDFSAGFVPFSHMLHSEGGDFALKNLIRQSCQEIAQAGVFAETLEQVLQPEHMAKGPVNVVDISLLPDPWKGLFYEEISRLALEAAGETLMPVLIYPEHFLSDPAALIRKADELEQPLVVMASPYATELLGEMADNVLLAESEHRLYLEGELSLGLPVSFPLPQGLVADSKAMPPDPHADVQIVRRPAQTVVDLSAPVPEPGLPAPLPETLAAKPYFNVTQPKPATGEGEELPEAPWPAEDPNQVPTWTETPVDRVDVYQPQAVPEKPEPVPLPEAAAAHPSEPSPAAPAPYETAPAFPEATEADDFNFDVNLDNKPVEDWETPLPGIGPVETPVPPAVAESMQEFENLEMPESPVPEPPAPTYEPIFEETPGEEPVWEERSAEAAETEEEEPDFPAYTEETSGPIPLTASEETDALPPIVPRHPEPDAVANPGGFQPGDKVRHETYGLGIVNKVIPMEENVVLNITFEHVGKRLLDPSLCTLTREPG